MTPEPGTDTPADTPADTPEGAVPPTDSDLTPEERALLAGFDRLSPQGSLRWGFDDAMRRIENPDPDAGPGAAPFKGLPGDLWERGRTARIGQRFVGDVAGVMADVLAADARAVAVTAAASGNVAVWDALRYLSARVEQLEARVDPLGLAAAEWPVPVADPAEWADRVVSWLPPSGPAPVVVGESGDGRVLAALVADGRRVVGIEPRGESVWRSLVPPGPAVTDGAGGESARAESGGVESGGVESAGVESAGVAPAEVVLAEVADHLGTLPTAGAAAVVLVGCVDRADRAVQIGLLADAYRVVRPGGTVVILATDQQAWSEALSPPARDLLPGHPLHPETWSLLLRRLGAVDVEWHPAGSGRLHAVVGRVPGSAGSVGSAGEGEDP